MRRLKAGQEADLASRESPQVPESGFGRPPMHRHRSEIMPRALVGDDDITPFVLHDNDLVDDLEDLVAFDSLDHDTETEFDPELTRRTSLEALARTTAPPAGETGENTVATSPTTIGDPRVTAMRELYLRGDTENALSLADEIASMIPPPMAAEAPRAAHLDPNTDEDVASEASFGIFSDTIRPRTTR